MERKVTNALDVRLPVEVVELLHLRTHDGQAVLVECESVDELVMTRLLRRLPGDTLERIKRERERKSDQPADPAATDEHDRVLDTYGPLMIELGTMLRDANGGEVRPAFWFSPEKPRHPLSIPGRLLRLEDKLRLIEAVGRMSGYGGGAAAEGATFHAGERAGGPGGVGAVPAGEAVGQDPLGGPA